MHQKTSQSDRLHIALYGRTNSGKSTLINALTRQTVSLVSDVPGTTTDPVSKAMEVPEVGAVVFIDTPGFDDCTVLGEERVKVSLRSLDRVDIALLLLSESLEATDKEWLLCLREKEIPTLVLLTKADLYSYGKEELAVLTQTLESDPLIVSAHNPEDIERIYRSIADIVSARGEKEHTITGNLVESGDVVVLVMPQDSSAPKGRLILPQVQTIRELLDKGCVVVSCTPQSLQNSLAALAVLPKLIITDSQVFKEVYPLLPQGALLTSFSVLFASYKGDSDLFVVGANFLDSLGDKSRILIAEACTHAPRNEDIGRVKLPKMLRQKLGEDIQIDICSGADFPDDLSSYDLIIHCGACMFNRKAVQSRIVRAVSQGIPITNYGMAIAALTGILPYVAIPYKTECNNNE